ncbi:MAG TPA: hypothetical protein VN699_02245, partial [Pirellulales bacterium]|nr:hypothetical protein [Pirellulales bacterium]
LGYHYGYLGFPREAVRELDKAIKLNPQDQLAAKLKSIMAAKFAPAAAPALPAPAKQDALPPPATT